MANYPPGIGVNSTIHIKDHSAELAGVRRELEKLQKELKELKGIRTYTVFLPGMEVWEVEASSEEEAILKAQDDDGTKRRTIRGPGFPAAKVKNG